MSGAMAGEPAQLPADGGATAGEPAAVGGVKSTIGDIEKEKKIAPADGGDEQTIVPAIGGIKKEKKIAPRQRSAGNDVVSDDDSYSSYTEEEGHPRIAAVDAEPQSVSDSDSSYTPAWKRRRAGPHREQEHPSPSPSPPRRSGSVLAVGRQLIKKGVVPQTKKAPLKVPKEKAPSPSPSPPRRRGSVLAVGRPKKAPLQVPKKKTPSPRGSILAEKGFVPQTKKAPEKKAPKRRVVLQRRQEHPSPSR